MGTIESWQIIVFAMALLLIAIIVGAVVFVTTLVRRERSETPPTGPHPTGPFPPTS